MYEFLLDLDQGRDYYRTQLNTTYYINPTSTSHGQIQRFGTSATVMGWHFQESDTIRAAFTANLLNQIASLPNHILLLIATLIRKEFRESAMLFGPANFNIRHSIDEFHIEYDGYAGGDVEFAI